MAFRDILPVKLCAEMFKLCKNRGYAGVGML